MNRLHNLRSNERWSTLGIRTYLASGRLTAAAGFNAGRLLYYLGPDQKHPESRKYGATTRPFSFSEDQTSETGFVLPAHI